MADQNPRDRDVLDPAPSLLSDDLKAQSAVPSIQRPVHTALHYRGLGVVA